MNSDSVNIKPQPHADTRPTIYASIHFPSSPCTQALLSWQSSHGTFLLCRTHGHRRFAAIDFASPATVSWHKLGRLISLMITKIDVRHDALLAHNAVRLFQLEEYHKWKGYLQGLQICSLQYVIEVVRVQLRAEGAISSVI